jgi:hypothetical protein
VTDRLLEILKANANRGGLAMATEARLVDALRCTPAELAVAVEGLVAGKAIEVLSPLPYLVAKTRTSWAGSGETSAKVSGDSGRPYSYADSFINQKAMQAEQNSYSAETDDEVIAEILATLGETDAEPFRGLLAHYPRTVIHRALDRVRSAKSIQKSRTALFRYLLPRIVKETAPKP